MNVLCVVAHPDDEVLGCGGTLAKHVDDGATGNVAVFCGRGIEGELKAAARVLGVGHSALDFADQKLDAYRFSELVEAVEAWGETPAGDPDVVYTHHPGDLNLDHALVARAVLTAFRPKPGAKPCTILASEVLSSTEYTYPRVFQPNWYVGLTAEQVTQAQDALACYGSEVQPYPHPRSRTAIRNRAAVRGSEIGVDYAEAFQLLRGGPF